jgi:hypothetical protein
MVRLNLLPSWVGLGFSCDLRLSRVVLRAAMARLQNLITTVGLLEPALCLRLFSQLLCGMAEVVAARPPGAELADGEKFPEGGDEGDGSDGDGEEKKGGSGSAGAAGFGDADDDEFGGEHDKGFFEEFSVTADEQRYAAALARVLPVCGMRQILTQWAGNGGADRAAKLAHGLALWLLRPKAAERAGALQRREWALALCEVLSGCTHRPTLELLPQIMDTVVKAAATPMDAGKSAEAAQKLPATSARRRALAEAVAEQRLGKVGLAQLLTARLEECGRNNGAQLLQALAQSVDPAVFKALKLDGGSR